MDLRSDSPFWLLKNGLLRCYPPLTDDIRSEVVVIGGGITGALVSHALVASGIDVVLVDKREIAQGSTSASTALLQYEIDTHLTELSRLRGEEQAVRAYRLCLEAIDELARLTSDLPDQCGFERQSSLYFVSKRGQLKDVHDECDLRKRHGFPVEWCDAKTVRERFQFNAPGAILSHAGAVVDPFQLTHRLLEQSQTRGLKVFDRTTIESWHETAEGLELTTNRQAKIRAKTMILACGYEAQSYLSEPVVSLKSTYAFVTGPDQPSWWGECGMVWESARPYLYLRRTTNNRIIVGGEDDDFRSPSRRDSRLEYKTQRLVNRIKKLFPSATVEEEYSWAGTFGETKDGLGYIGPSAELPRTYFALGFGGNGITFSVVASQILTDLVLGRKNDDADLFRFGR